MTHYIVINENEIVKAEMERPVPLPSEFAAPSPAMQSVINNYKAHCLSLPRIAAPGHKWQLWQEIELDKDFRMEEQFWTGSAWQPTFHLVIGNPGTKTRIVAIPIQPTPEGEKEFLRKLHELVTTPYKNKSFFYAFLKYFNNSGECGGDKFNDDMEAYYKEKFNEEM